MSYWSKVLEEVLNKHDPLYPTVLTNVKEYTNLQKAETDEPKKAIESPAVSRHLAKKHTQLFGATKKYSLGKKFPGVYLTRREAQVIFCFIHGMSTTQTAKALELSRRTVEFYISNMKIKLDCRFKSELISKAIQSDFLTLIDFSL